MDYERPKYHRQAAPEAMDVQLFVDGEAWSGYIFDLNNAGAFVVTDLVLERRARIEIELAVPAEPNTMKLKAIVIRRSELIKGRARDIPAGLGVVFMPESRTERAFIQKAVLAVLKGNLETTRKILEASESGENAQP